MDHLNDRPSLFGSDPDVIEIGIGELVIASAPKRLLTPALGSCVGITLYAPDRRMGGMAHIMLPKPGGDRFGEPGRFADYAVPELLRRMVEQGCRRTAIEAKIAGGAAMFRGEEFVAGIGDRNLAEVRRQLDLLGIRVVGEDVGESHARTIELDLVTGELQVRSYQFGLVTV